MKLHADTIAMITERAEELADHCSSCDPDDAATWADTIAALLAVEADPTVQTLAANLDAAKELEFNLDRDEYWNDDQTKPNARHRHITADLCRAGLHERHDDNAVCSRRPKTMTVDGVRYDVG